MFLTFASGHLGSTVANVRNGPRASLTSHASGAALPPAGVANHRLRRDRVRRRQARQKTAAPPSLRMIAPVSKFGGSARREFTPPRTEPIRAAGRAMYGVVHGMHGKYVRRLQNAFVRAAACPR